ncbi:hypothetical protein FHT78_002280 [Rhizobium sp. BK196]|uniref:hypothetical protein n=1 Tax=Rhizobium sp. BK196 TaxID=2587073 RepID=UPI001608EC71|nr:hypothetical protein [Rhizobium sp. BK196]MBB3310536.1 hypothetical protein [Rhizobium sp. BK196]
MTTTGIGHIATFTRTAAICAAAAAMAFALAGCNKTAEEKKAFAQRMAAPTAVVMPASKGEPVEGGLTKSRDGYPSFGAPLTAANVQMSDEQAAELQHQLTALSAKRQSGAISEAEYQRRVTEMRELAARHGAETLSEITK